MNDIERIYERYEHQVDLVLDGGNSILTLSTVLDLTDDRPVVVRKGAGDLRSVLIEKEL
jgi:tRNA A37 threonylcarbamoyladenosine synthetase subunit TsaC/SUA5/YrdC